MPGHLLQFHRSAGSVLALKAIPRLDPRSTLIAAVYFGTRDLVVRRARQPGARSLCLLLFAFLYRNAVKMVDRFHSARAKCRGNCPAYSDLRACDVAPVTGIVSFVQKASSPSRSTRRPRAW